MKIKSLLLSVLALSAFVACQEKQTILTPSQDIVCDHNHKKHQNREDRRDFAGHAPG